MTHRYRELALPLAEKAKSTVRLRDIPRYKLDALFSCLSV